MSTKQDHALLGPQAYVELSRFLNLHPLPIPHALSTQLTAHLEEAEPTEGKAQEKLDKLREQVTKLSTALKGAQSRLRDFQQAFEDSGLELPKAGYAHERRIAKLAANSREALDKSDAANMYAEGESRGEDQGAEEPGEE